MTSLLALIGFSFVSSVTPGPNNVLLWASGATFGFRRTVPHIIGTALGIGAMAVGAAAGLAALVTAFPPIGIAMKVAGSIYLVYLAIQIARSGAFEAGVVAHPLSLGAAAAFQLINPKAWIFAIGAVTTFRPVELPIVTGSLLVALTMMAVIVPSAAVWAAGGGTLGRLLTGERSRRIVSLVLAALVIATVASVWI